MKVPINVLAFGLTDLLKTEAFRGSLGILQKFQWVGAAMQWVISIFSLIGLFLVCYQLFVTLLYFSSRTTFDMIYDLKKGSSGGFLGLQGIFNDLKTGSKASGVDAVITFVLSLAPNVKAYSYYNPERMNSKLSEDDSCLTFVLKIAPSTICMIFFLTIGWNGLLFQAFGTVVDGLSYVADNVIDIQFTKYIDRVMQMGSGYKFTFDVDDSELGQLRQSVARKINSKVLRKITNVNEKQQEILGNNIEIWVTQNVTLDELKKFGCKAEYDPATVGQHVNVDGTSGAVSGHAKILNEYDLKNIDYIVNVNSSSLSVSDDYMLSFASLGITLEGASEDGSPQEYYVHIGVTRDSSAAEYSYWKTPETSN